MPCRSTSATKSRGRSAPAPTWQVRIGGKKILRPGVQVGEIAASPARDQDLAADLGVMLQYRTRRPRFPASMAHINPAAPAPITSTSIAWAGSHYLRSSSALDIQRRSACGGSGCGHAIDVLVIGAGAAGLMCAIEAGKRGRRVAVLEHNAQIGRKILISGGGRCNFTNLHTRPENFLSANPHFAKSALARYGPRDFVALVERHGIAYHEKTAGQLFCNGSAREDRGSAGGRMRRGGSAHRRPAGRCAAYAGGRLRSGGRRRFLAGRIAGDLDRRALDSKAGASSFGYSIAAQFGLRLVECRPALAPLTFQRAEQAKFAPLAGVSVEVVAHAGGHSFREKMLLYPPRHQWTGGAPGLVLLEAG